MKKSRAAGLRAHQLHAHKGDTDDLAARLAPLEELLSANAEREGTRDADSPVVDQEDGAIVVGRHQPALSEDAIEVAYRKPLFEPVVMVIVGLLLAFILFIAWQISRMPGVPD